MAASLPAAAPEAGPASSREGALRALVVHPGFLGDTVFLGPAVRALKARWPDGRVALCVTPRGEDVARRLPGCDEVVVHDKRGRDRGVGGLWRTASRLRAFGPAIALVPHYSPRAGALAWLSGAPRRIGYAALCTERVPLDRSRPFVDRALVLAERAGAPGGDSSLALSSPPELAAYAGGILAAAHGPVFGLVPGAEWATKRWGAERFGELASGLVRRGATVVLLGGPGDRDDARRIRERAGEAVLDTTGNTIAEAIALLDRCDVVVGGDTGLVHCARALGRATLALFGPTDPGRHRFAARQRFVALQLECQPCHDHGPERCPLGHHACMRDLPVEAVAREAWALLDAPLP
jgi:heptosyltransferase-2